MPYPSMSEYREVLQNPKLAFRTSELQTAHVKTSPLGLPLLVSGGFALTACLTTNSNGYQSKFAIRCFHKEVPDLQDRYKYISNFLQKYKENFLVNFTYDPDGIKVQGRWYPIVKMDWVEGKSLLEYIDANILNPAKLKVFAEQLRIIGSRLNQLKIAHGDLQHGNILVRSDDSPVLIDYDGTYVEGMPFTKSNELGHSSYQHPGRSSSFFNERVDNFSLAVIYVSLHILSSSQGSQIWRKYRDSEKLIFSKEDYRNPASSAIFQELSKNTQVYPLIERLKSLCTLPAEHLPTLEDFLNPTFTVPTISEGTSVNSSISGMSKISDVVMQGQYKIIKATDLESLILQDGNQITVIGKVLRTGKTVSGKIAFINFGQRNARLTYNSFSIVIFSQGLQAWNQSNNTNIESLKSKYVKITGLLELHKKRNNSLITPQIILSDPFQIKIIREDEYRALTQFSLPDNQSSLPDKPKPQPTQVISSFPKASSQNSLPPNPIPPKPVPPKPVPPKSTPFPPQRSQQPLASVPSTLSTPSQQSGSSNSHSYSNSSTSSTINQQPSSSNDQQKIDSNKESKIGGPVGALIGARAAVGAWLKSLIR